MGQKRKIHRWSWCGNKYKNAYENDEKCEHRIELNPNIQYRKQQKKDAAQAAAIVKTDQESLVQGIIWSEILGKPKAYQPNQPVFRTGRSRWLLHQQKQTTRWEAFSAGFLYA